MTDAERAAYRAGYKDALREMVKVIRAHHFAQDIVHRTTGGTSMLTPSEARKDLIAAIFAMMESVAGTDESEPATERAREEADTAGTVARPQTAETK